jgi:hypothetical protein
MDAVGVGGRRGHVVDVVAVVLVIDVVPVVPVVAAGAVRLDALGDRVDDLRRVGVHRLELEVATALGVAGAVLEADTAVLDDDSMRVSEDRALGLGHAVVQDLDVIAGRDEGRRRKRGVANRVAGDLSGREWSGVACPEEHAQQQNQRLHGNDYGMCSAMSG